MPGDVTKCSVFTRVSLRAYALGALIKGPKHAVPTSHIQLTSSLAFAMTGQTVIFTAASLVVLYGVQKVLEYRRLVAQCG